MLPVTLNRAGQHNLSLPVIAMKYFPRTWGPNNTRTPALAQTKHLPSSWSSFHPWEARDAWGSA